MENKIIISREERLVKFAELCPDSALELFSLGEPVSFEFLKEMTLINSEFVDKLFNIGFAVKYEFDPYSVGCMETDDTQRIYEFMKTRYGKKTAENMVIEKSGLWYSFLPYASKALNEDGRLTAKFQELISNKDYDVVYHFLGCLAKKYRLVVQKSVSDEEFVLFVEYANKTYLAGACSATFTVDYLVDKNILSPDIIDIYVANHSTDYALKKLFRKKNAFELIKQRNDWLSYRAEEIFAELNKKKK